MTKRAGANTPKVVDFLGKAFTLRDNLAAAKEKATNLAPDAPPDIEIRDQLQRAASQYMQLARQFEKLDAGAHAEVADSLFDRASYLTFQFGAVHTKWSHSFAAGSDHLVYTTDSALETLMLGITSFVEK